MAPRTLPTVSPNLGFANWTPSTVLAEHNHFRFSHKLTHAADMDSGQVPVSPYAHNLFSYHYMHGLINPPVLGQPSPFRVSGPETRSRPPSRAAQLMVEHFLAVANFLLPQSTSSSLSLFSPSTLSCLGCFYLLHCLSPTCHAYSIQRGRGRRCSEIAMVHSNAQTGCISLSLSLSQQQRG